VPEVVAGEQPKA
jgi:hypothetical protein